MHLPLLEGLLKFLILIFIYNSTQAIKSPVTKGQLIWKVNCQAVNSSKKRTNEFVFTSMRHVFVRFFEESLARKKTF